MEDNESINGLKKQVIEQQSDLSDDLILEEILTRLPVKSIFRFKSVSKLWYSTLSSSHFANAHLTKFPLFHPSAPVDTLFITDSTNPYLFSYDDDQISGNFEDNLVKLNLEFWVEEDEIEVAGCCNGLVCLTPLYSEYFIIWNPATRKFHKYAWSHGYFKRFDDSHKVISAPGFGYASSVDVYKYVQILTVYEGLAISDSSVCIFSLRENRWREIDFGNDPLRLVSKALLVGEKLYWCAESNRARNLLVSFDLGVERFDVIEIDGDGFYSFGVMRGCLSKCNHCETLIMDIIEPPAIVKSIGLPKELRLNRISDMIGYTKTDKFFVTVSDRDEERDLFSGMSLGIVDTCTRPMQYTKLLSFNDEMRINIERYVPSLIWPFPSEEPLEA